MMLTCSIISGQGGEYDAFHGDIVDFDNFKEAYDYGMANGVNAPAGFGFTLHLDDEKRTLVYQAIYSTGLRSFIFTDFTKPIDEDEFEDGEPA